MTPARGERRHRGPEDGVDVIRLTAVPRSAWASGDAADRLDQLEAELQAMEGFAARAAHELVGPLVAIEAYSTSVTTRLPSGDFALRRDVERIGRIAARARRLVETLLYAARGERDIERVAVDLGATLADVAASLKEDIRDRSATVDVGELPTVCGDPVLLASLFTNLVVNALRYGPRERGRIVIHATQEPSGEWRVMVDSDGTPMPAEDRERIFGPFERGSQERRTPGAGLGLAISRDIVERHGGRIGVVPIPRGNRFWLTLPPME